MHYTEVQPVEYSITVHANPSIAAKFKNKEKALAWMDMFKKNVEALLDSIDGEIDWEPDLNDY